MLEEYQSSRIQILCPHQLRDRLWTAEQIQNDSATLIQLEGFDFQILISAKPTSINVAWEYFDF